MQCDFHWTATNAACRVVRHACISVRARKDGRKYASARLNSQREKGGEVGRRVGRFAVEISS